MVCRDENPVGQWTIRVFDQGNAEENGNFLGWTMTFWGSAKDSSQATKYELPDDPNEGHNLPPHPSATEDAEQTKQHPKPTANLPEDHAAAAGEATRPAFSTEEKEGSATPTSSPTSLPDAGDQGVFSHMYDLMSNQLWLVGAFGIVVMFGVGTAGFLWLRKRKAARRAKSAYAPLGATDDMAMRQIDRDGAVAGTGGERSAGGTRELYDAFGVGSDDEDDDENERSALTGTGRYNQPTGLTYHNGFLDDEGMSTGRSAPEPYRDDPDTHGEHSTDKATPARDGSEGSGDGSWQDASEAPHTRPVD
jgi:kexin